MKTTETLKIVRLWVTALTVTVLVAVWALISRTPFPQAAGASVSNTATPPATTDPRAAALQQREAAYRVRALRVQASQRRIWARYRADLAARRQLIAQVTASNQSAPAYAAPSGGGSSWSAPSTPVISVAPASSAPAPSASTQSS